MEAGEKGWVGLENQEVGRVREEEAPAGHRILGFQRLIAGVAEVYPEQFARRRVVVDQENRLAPPPGFHRGSVTAVDVCAPLVFTSGMPPQLGTFAPSAQSRCRQVLIVEDNVDQAQTLRMFLSMKGHRLEIAGNRPAAIDVARRFRPDVGLLDLGLPGVDGFEVGRPTKNKYGRAAPPV